MNSNIVKQQRSDIAVIICSLGRSDVLDTTLQSVFAQSLPPSQIIISVTTADDLSSTTRRDCRIEVVMSPTGSSIQRNKAIHSVNRECKIVCFLDDDVELDRHYLEYIREEMSANPEIAVASGRLVADGCNNVPVSREKARCLLADCSHPSNNDGDPVEVINAYGCNMCVRRELLDSVQFDERLALYGWLEDADFCHQCRQAGKVVRSKRAALVHLGILSGRVSGLRFGFSQIMNPLYLARKGSLPSLYHVVKNHWAKAVISNVLYSILGDPYVDRYGRLRGNLIAFRMIAAANVKPEYVRRLQ
jgi:GT2 family glycosyltransferase